MIAPAHSALIRWAGSKRQLLPKLIRQVPATFRQYIEPFAGSACLFFAINPRKAILSDSNCDLIDTYKTIRRHPIRVLRLARAIKVDPNRYYRIRAQDPQDLSAIDRAVRFLYLNRHCFNALYRTNSSGAFNVPMGRRTGGFPDEQTFRASAAALSRAELVCSDFEATLARAKKGDFVYLDPPYVSRPGADKNVYGCGSFCARDLPRLMRSLEVLNRNKVHFLLSYLACPELLSLLECKPHRAISVWRKISGKQNGRKFAKEVLLNNRDVFGPSALTVN
jgi:DNA adenine methylase